MISGILASLVMMSATGAGNDPPELEALLSRVAATETTEFEFSETRKSELLEEPLVVSGTLRREGNRLIRQTTAPTVETQTLTESHVEIRRPDRTRQRFSLRRAPELAILRSGLLGLFDGDREALEEHFVIEVGKDDCRDDCGDNCKVDGPAGHWRLTLEPRDHGEPSPVRQMSLTGRDDQLHGFSLELADGEMVETVIEATR